MDISLVCCYTKEDMAMDMKRSAEKSNLEIEFILIDNSKNAFKSAASALNYGFDKSTSDVVVFLHQDIIFENPDDICRIYKYLIDKRNVVLGVAGNSGDSRGIVSTIFTVDNKERTYSMVNEIEEVKGLDECLIAVNRKVFESIRFDEEIFDGWHLYGADLSEQARQKGMCVQVMSSDIRHLSNGNIDKSYKTTLKKFRKKYKNKTDKIYYSFGWCFTGFLKYNMCELYRIIRYKKKNYL